MPSLGDSFDIHMADGVMNIIYKIIGRMQKLNIPMEKDGSARYKMLSSAINHIADLYKNNPKALKVVENRVHEKMNELTAFMKLLRDYETPENQHMIGYLATSSALLNYLVYGNEGQTTFENCLTVKNGNSYVLRTTPEFMILDLSSIGHYVDNVKNVSPKLLDLACCKDGKDSALTDKSCKKSRDLFKNSMFFVPSMIEGLSAENPIDEGILTDIDNIIKNGLNSDNPESDVM